MAKAEVRSGMANVIHTAGKCATAVTERIGDGPMDAECCLGKGAPTKAKVIKQNSREILYRKNAECEVYDDGTNTFFWWVIPCNVNIVNVKCSALNTDYKYGFEGDISSHHVLLETWLTKCTILTSAILHLNTIGEIFTSDKLP